MTNRIKLEILFSLLVVGLFSCNEGTADKSAQASTETEYTMLNIAGQVFFYAPELDTTTCEAFGQCDCCSGNFLFLNDNNFVTINVCEADNWYCKGKYKIANGNLILTYDSLMVWENYNWENETDTTATKDIPPSITTSKTKTWTLMLTRFECGKNIYFKTEDKHMTFITLDKKQKLSDLIKPLQDRGIWGKLEIK